MNIDHLQSLVGIGIKIEKCHKWSCNQYATYMLCDSDGIIVYVGKCSTGKIGQRIYVHTKDKVFSNSYLIELDSKTDCEDAEKGLIVLCNPVYNILKYPYIYYVSAIRRLLKMNIPLEIPVGHDHCKISTKCRSSNHGVHSVKRKSTKIISSYRFKSSCKRRDGFKFLMLKEAFEKRGHTISTFSELSGVDEALIKMWITGEFPITPLELIDISQMLRCSVRDLFVIEGYPQVTRIKSSSLKITSKGIQFTPSIAC